MLGGRPESVGRSSLQGKPPTLFAGTLHRLVEGTSLWRKQQEQGRLGAGRQPTGRRGHTCVIYNGAMHLFGGYQDLKGSSAELWGFHFGTSLWRKQQEQGRLGAGRQPTGRRGHTCVIYNGAMHLFGGYQDLKGSSAELWGFHFANFLFYASFDGDKREVGELR
ncbi:conserved hypothetical protein [Ixodes scapularis]|uniref:Uncharacterized protein n=1 Tax=Ixodes scapularis TaxID=6945 RepID=B7P5B8_IXOSC|nr:conserved hypothetical protein [Ixodes scapularis]|eukprot:XP_002407230.1 conserved hypothetical protein [Ixodes scapularis]